MPRDESFAKTEPVSITDALSRVDRFSLLIHHRDGLLVVDLDVDQPVTLGRDEESATVVLPEPSLSRRHVRFVRDDQGVVVEDLRSTNGTHLNGERITRARLYPGDQVGAGAVTITLHIPSAGEAFAGLEAHETFLGHVEDEVRRAECLNRGFALAMVGAGGTRPPPLSKWSPAVRQHLRSVDRGALYGPRIIEVLLPEMTDKAVESWARQVRGATRVALHVAYAVYGKAGKTAEQLLEQTREALTEATHDAPVVQASAESFRITPGGAPIARSPVMRKVFEQADRFASSALNVLVMGETGAGKEVLAQRLHQHSPRAEGPLRAVNCAAISPTLIQSTLFGHVKGAFTGANEDKKGLFQEAEGGTVFLDEIGELSAEAQAVLLRALETKRISRVGRPGEEIPVDVRVVAATHRSLEAMVEQGSFRRDLMFRLNTVVLEIPPLRERIEDIEPLVRRFLTMANEANDRQVSEVDEATLDVLRSYRWPGNVRELKNVVERAVVIARGDVVTLEDLPTRLLDGARTERQPVPLDPGDDLPDFKTQMREHEVRVLTRALERTRWNQTKAAKLLQMPLRTLVHKLRAHGLRRPE
jgi:DNA-binding NtrC family response regulator